MKQMKASDKNDCRYSQAFPSAHCSSFLLIAAPIIIVILQTICRAHTHFPQKPGDCVTCVIRIVSPISTTFHQPRSSFFFHIHVGLCSLFWGSGISALSLLIRPINQLYSHTHTATVVTAISSFFLFRFVCVSWKEKKRGSFTVETINTPCVHHTHFPICAAAAAVQMMQNGWDFFFFFKPTNLYTAMISCTKHLSKSFRISPTYSLQSYCQVQTSLFREQLKCHDFCYFVLLLVGHSLYNNHRCCYFRCRQEKERKKNSNHAALIYFDIYL